ncbi:MAG: DUF86 domain-containing protein [Proteobacteria bacterium]|nr:DUF86 domain-containing protein [Pseudomonadota bacterium]
MNRESKKIKSHTDKLLAYLNENHITRDSVLNNEIVRWTITTPLYNNGEHAYSLSDEFKQIHANIPWSKIAGLRHRLVHDYENTNWSIINEILFTILPDFQKQIEQIVVQPMD